MFSHRSTETPQHHPPPAKARTRAEAKKRFAKAPEHAAKLFACGVFLPPTVIGDV
jgi:hypothetical protein